MIKANDPSLVSWAEVPANNDFPIQNLPFGIIRPKGASPRAATRIGDQAVDLHVLHGAGYFDGLDLPGEVLAAPVLNDFIALGKPVWHAVRHRLSELLDSRNEGLKNDRDTRDKAFFRLDEVDVLMPVHVGDYTDFYSSIEHATNVGKMFRDPANALLPNWKHIPVGYHGRSSSIVVSGAEIHRPKGQTKADDADSPTFGPCRMLDFELEMAFITGKDTALGESIPTATAEDAIFGMVIFNDLSARDIQKWEYVPLGPFLSKNFGSVISPWIVTMEALEPFRVDGPVQDPPVLDYLRYEGKRNFNINLEVSLRPGEGEETIVCRSNFRYMYWNMSQQLAHQTVNGCNVRVGDMYASGTISGSTPDSFGSMLELTWKGTRPIQMADGSERKFVNDQDTITMRGFAEHDGVRVGFGESVVKILPAR